MPRFALIEPSMGSSTTVTAPSARGRAVAELLAHEREVDARVVEQRDDRALRRVVDRRRVVATLSGADDPLALVARGQLGEDALDLGGGGAAELEPVRHSGMKSRPLGSLGIEVRALLRHRLAALGELADEIDARRAHEDGSLRGAGVHGGLRLLLVRRVRHSFEPEPVDERRVGLVGLTGHDRRPARPVDDGGRAIGRQRAVEGPLAVDRPEALGDPVRGEDREALLLRGDDDDEQPGALLGSLLGVVRERRLVAMVAVGDEQPRVGEDVRRVALKTPEPAAHALELHLQHALSVRSLESPVVEEEDRLHLRPERPQQAKAPLLRPRVRALVRQDDSGLVRLGAESAHEPLARPSDAVGPDVLLGEPPARGIVLADEDALREPRRPERGCLRLVVGEREVDDVVRAGGEVSVACRRVENVVRRRHERGERPGALLVVAHGPERSHLRHGAGRYQPDSALDSKPVAAIADLAEDGVVEGTYAVARKRRLRTRGGADYLALELVDPSGRIEGRVWHDVDLLDGRFAEGDAVRVLGRVERFRNQLQLDVRAIEPAEGADPAELTPTLRRDADELEGFLDFLAGEVSHPGLKAVVTAIVGDATLRRAFRALPASPEAHHVYAGGLLEHTVGVATICRELVQLHPRLRSDLLLGAALLHDVGRTRELKPGPGFQVTEEGRLLGHVHLGLRLVEERSAKLDEGVRAELLHAIACHHDARAAADRRGRLPLPREPAGRARRHAAGRDPCLGG